MEEVLGVLALAAYIVAIVSLAAGITYAVIKIFPTKRESNDGEATAEDKPAKPEPKKSSDEAAEGTLFRRSKRNRGKS